ncbi:MAG: thiamine phosphate synthase [Nitrospiraceae bacterium]|nr:MAG: thiamine phosphate synthase [Nitrospiraceae bacterium]
MTKIFPNPLYLITDTAFAGLSHSQIARRALAAGIRTLQMREKRMSKKELFHEALALRSITRKHRVTFIINDYIDIALAVDADGVHLGQEDMPLREARKIMGKEKIIGISTHTLKQAIEAGQAGADYIGFGPVFATATKDAGAPKGPGRLKEIRRHVRIPIVAIGGITTENVSSVMKAGADGVAVMSAVLKGDIGENVRELLTAINNNLPPQCPDG